MREFCAKYFSCQALVGKKNKENDVEDTTKSETKPSTLAKMKERFNNFIGGYRDFLFLGDGIHFAVAFILAGSFSNLINNFTSGFVTPWLGVIFGHTDFKSMSFTISGSKFPYGRFIDSLLIFLIMTFILYFAVLLPSKWLTEKFVKQEESNQTACLYCYSIISRKAIRCPNCTSSLEAVPEMVRSENFDMNQIVVNAKRIMKDLKDRDLQN